MDITVSRKEFVQHVITDCDPDPSYLEQEGFEDRLQAYRNGDFGYVGVWASAEVKIPTPQGGYSSLQTIRTPGLWGIESDSGKEYLNEVFTEECNMLVDTLSALNIKVED